MIINLGNRDIYIYVKFSCKIALVVEGKKLVLTGLTFIARISIPSKRKEDDELTPAWQHFLGEPANACENTHMLVSAFISNLYIRHLYHYSFNDEFPYWQNVMT